MKKQRKVSLALNKKTISNLRIHSIKGGETNTPGCGIELTGVSDCQQCMEDPTQGCSPGSGDFTRVICPSIIQLC